jgi:hypothetical protein
MKIEIQRNGLAVQYHHVQAEVSNIRAVAYLEEYLWSSMPWPNKLAFIPEIFSGKVRSFLPFE